MTIRSMPSRPEYHNTRKLRPHLIRFRGGRFDGCADWVKELDPTMRLVDQGREIWYRRTEEKTIVVEYEGLEATVYEFDRAESEKFWR